MAVVAPPDHAERAIQSLEATTLAAVAAQMKASPLPPSQEFAPKVVSIHPAQRQTATENQAMPVEEPAVPEAASAAAKNTQGSLEFIPTIGPAKSRTLKTSVEAVIYCDSPVAAPIHRTMAAFLDGSMIFLGLGVFLVIFQIFGGSFPWNKQNIALFAGAFALIAVFYGFVWVLAGRETMGMKWVDLRIVTFNGFPPDRKSRVLRSVGCLLSFCSGMIGIFWALVDEEGLTWHDHISKTFPTVKETDTGFLRQ